jgi:hypothetical protein
LLERDDADLFSVGSDEANRAEMNLVVYADFIVDAKLPPGVGP